MLQDLPVQHRKEEVEKSYATRRMRREKVEMAFTRSAIFAFFLPLQRTDIFNSKNKKSEKERKFQVYIGSRSPKVVLGL
jgi:hypothetical protein